MKLTLVAWILFFGGFGIEIVIDHFMRIQDENIHTGGIPESLWFLMHILFASISIWLAFLGTKPLIHPWKRVLVLGVEVGLGLILYVLMGLYYVVGTGIDSL